MCRALPVSLREALLSVAGNAIGVVVQAVAVAVGLGAIVAASATAYTALKTGAAAYSVYPAAPAIQHPRSRPRTPLHLSTHTNRPATTQ